MINDRSFCLWDNEDFLFDYRFSLRYFLYKNVVNKKRYLVSYTLRLTMCLMCWVYQITIKPVLKN